MSFAQKILIIDDDPMDINILRSILESDYALNIAINGRMGLKRARSEPYPDLVLLDVMMPEMDGFEVCEHLKADPVLREIPVIFITAKDKVADETRAFKAGAVDYIPKPFSIPVVMARVATHLAMHAAHVQLKQQYIALQEMERLRKDMEAISRHDLKTPINGIIGCTDLLLQDTTLSQPDLHKFYRLIRESASQLREMVNMSVSLIKMEQGCYEVTLQPISLLPILHRILADHRAWRERRRIETLMTVDGQPVQDQQVFMVLGDELLCYTLFANLYKNALEASEAGQVVSVTLRTGAMATVALHNHGVVPPVIREKFFEKYVTHGKKGGTGLGTYSARLMAETQRGSITLHSSEADGTTVTVALRQSPGANDENFDCR
ncbi:MAG: hybrid sensor histidine kinase/response regulator [Magnetococcales bacterium]|nr:hybrid sensor histidine kinase/response regulator [Magnetococcales bacterium]